MKAKKITAFLFVFIMALFLFPKLSFAAAPPADAVVKRIISNFRLSTDDRPNGGKTYTVSPAFDVVGYVANGSNGYEAKGVIHFYGSNGVVTVGLSGTTYIARTIPGVYKIVWTTDKWEYVQPNMVNLDIYGNAAVVPTPVPTATSAPTATPAPPPTATPEPTATPAPEPTATATPKPTPELKATVDVTIAKERIGVGKEFTAEISLRNVKDIYASDFEVTYDKEHLQYTGFEEITGYKVYNKPTDLNGALRFIVASQGENYGINKDTVILKLKFKAKAVGTALVDSTKARIADTEQEYDLEKENCLQDSILIEAADVNKSGQYTLLDLAIDARYFKYFAADVDPVKYNADQAGDEYVNDDDLLYIVDQMLNNPDYSPNT